MNLRKEFVIVFRGVTNRIILYLIRFEWFLKWGNILKVQSNTQFVELMKYFGIYILSVWKLPKGCISNSMPRPMKYTTLESNIHSKLVSNIISEYINRIYTKSYKLVPNIILQYTFFLSR